MIAFILVNRIKRDMHLKSIYNMATDFNGTKLLKCA